MSSPKKADQPGLFDPRERVSEADVIRYALGDFQDRGFELVGRELALDRLLGAFKRAYVAFDIMDLNDDVVASALIDMGAKVDRVPEFVAKHPYRVTVSEDLAEESLAYFSSFKE